MRSLSLHLKTTLLAAAVILLVTAATLIVFSSHVLSNVRQDQKELAELQAASLAEQISSSQTPRNYADIADSVALVSQSRPNIVAVRVWERNGDSFVEKLRNDENLPATEISDDIKAAIVKRKISRGEEKDAAGEFDYRIFVPVTAQNRVTGAVEIVENLETSWNLARRFLWSEIWLAGAAVVVLSFSIYALFSLFVYRPLGEVISAMQRAKSGELNARAEIETGDEIGELAAELNRMLAQIEQMTEERETQKEILRERVLEATGELQIRNAQLERASLEIWETTRKLSELERLASAGQTAAQLAHEVGTPLNLISGHVQLLSLSLNGDKTARNRIDIIIEQIERIEKIVRGMLDRTRFGEVELVPVQLNSILRRVFDVVAPTLEAKQVRLIAKLDGLLPETIGNDDRLQQVFINLFNNALDAMPAGGELRVATKLEASKLCVEIADTGAGMGDKTKTRIFEPLFTTKQRGQGTGLGLVVVRQILQEHGAEIAVESTLDKGTIFYLSFPILDNEKNFSS